jgi:hypothetical protein
MDETLNYYLSINNGCKIKTKQLLKSLMAIEVRKINYEMSCIFRDLIKQLE